MRCASGRRARHRKRRHHGSMPDGAWRAIRSRCDASR